MVSQADEPKRVKRPFNHDGKARYITLPSGEVVVIGPGKRGGLLELPEGAAVKVVKVKSGPGCGGPSLKIEDC